MIEEITKLFLGGYGIGVFMGGVSALIGTVINKSQNILKGDVTNV